MHGRMPVQAGFFRENLLYRHHVLVRGFIVNVRGNLTQTMTLREDAHGFAKEICGLHRTNPGYHSRRSKRAE